MTQTITPTQPHRIFYAWYYTRTGLCKGPYVVIASSPDEAKDWADVGNGALAVEAAYDPNLKEQLQ